MEADVVVTLIIIIIIIIIIVVVFVDNSTTVERKGQKKNYQSRGFLGSAVVGRAIDVNLLELVEEVVGEVDLQVAAVAVPVADKFAGDGGLAFGAPDGDVQLLSPLVRGLHSSSLSGHFFQSI